MPEHNELFTLRDYVRYAVTRFQEAGLYYGHGTDNAWDEATALILHILHLPHDVNPTVLDARLTIKERKEVLKVLSKRVDQKIPAPYLTHEAWFAGLPFYVDERVLIPRSPVAELIDHQFAPWIKPEQVHNILDLCTGSGCIAIACALAFPDAAVDGVDISIEALTVAQINVAKHQVEAQVSLHESDLFHGLPIKKYDVLISNPPYVSSEEMTTLPSEYLHEPELGLSAGVLGLDFVLRILFEAHHYLSPEGILIVEVGNSQDALINRYPDVPFTWLEFEQGEGEVFLLTAQQVNDHFTSSISLAGKS